MMKNTLTAFLFLALITGCSKNKFQTKPQLKLLSTSALDVAKNGTLEVSLEFTDKEGDVDDSVLVRRYRTNRRPVGPQGTKLDSFRLKIPDFPDRQKGELNIIFSYQDLIMTVDDLSVPGTNPVQIESDSIVYKFVARDKAGNKSDTLVLNNVVVHR
jgi:hypothetical protein